MFQTFDDASAPAATAPRLAALRTFMRQRRIALDALLVPRADEYQNEYVPAGAERLAYMTGFTGSAGLAVVTAKTAALFVDGRYTVQAPREVDTRLFTIKGIRTSDLVPWLGETLAPGARVGFDPQLHTVAEIEGLAADLAGCGLELVEVTRNLVDRVWGAERPARPSAPVTVQPMEHAGQSADDKIAAVRARLKADRQQAVVLSATDSVCWLFNIRGRDIPHNPVVLAHAIVPAKGKPQLFVDREKLGPEVRIHLASLAKIRTPESWPEALAELRTGGGDPVRIAPRQISHATWRALGGRRRVVQGSDPCSELKAIKNAVEIAGARRAHERDGVAVTRFLAWLDHEAAHGTVDEIGAVTRLEAFRRETGVLEDISFPTIAGSGPNGAIVHYRVNRASNRALQAGELFLIDSGGQYRDGTTDITRTVAIGTPTDEMARRFTLVLEGMIAVATARFPVGTRGTEIDPFARQALWRHGLGYDHGTGHGVGSYLNVHEGPPSISRSGTTVLQPGTILSNEPGYYKTGGYGIRIENLILVTAPEDVGGDQPMMGFETLTLAPIDRRLILPALLSPEARAWLDAYHARVQRTLAPHLDKATRAWLAAATTPLGEAPAMMRAAATAEAPAAKRAPATKTGAEKAPVKTARSGKAPVGTGLAALRLETVRPSGVSRASVETTRRTTAAVTKRGKARNRRS